MRSRVRIRPAPWCSTAAAALLVVAVAGCGGLAVRTHYDPSARTLTPSYHTYAWFPAATDPDRANATYGLEIRSAVDIALVGRGYVRADSGTADFSLGWHLTGQEAVLTSTLNDYYGYTWGRWFPGGGVVFSGGFKAEVEPYTLVLDVADGRARELVWRGQAALDPRALGDPARRSIEIRRAVTALLERFPPS